MYVVIFDCFVFELLIINEFIGDEMILFVLEIVDLECG